MVNATVDNAPVSIQLNGSSTTVPSNETWVVRVTVHRGFAQATLAVNGLDGMSASSNNSDPAAPELTMTLTGGDKIEETDGRSGGLVTVQGFVVDT